MDPKTKALINAAVATARDCQTQITAFLNAGRSADDAEIVALYAKYDAALEDGDRLNAQVRRDQRVADLAAASAEEAIIETETAVELSGANASDVEYARQFNAYINRYGRGHDEWEAISAERQNMVIQSDPDGGYTVPVDRRPDVIRVTPAISEVLAFVNSFPTSRREVEWVRVQPHADSPDIYTSAFVGRMIPETTTLNATPPKFGMFGISLHKARSDARFSMDLATDSALDMNAFLNEDGTLNHGLLREQQVLVGDGIGNNLLGVMNHPDIDATNDVSGTTADEVSNSVSDPGSAPKLLDWFHSVPAQYRRMPSFRVVWNSDTNKKVRKLVDASGNFIWRPGFAGTPNTFEEKPVAISEFLASGGTNANRIAIAGPLAEIQHPINSNVAVQVLLERYADEELIAMFIRSRFGVGVGNPRAFRIAVV